MPRGKVEDASRWLDSKHHIQHHIYVLTPIKPLPRIDLSRTLARRIWTPSAHARALKFMRSYFHFLVAKYRLGIVCFGCLLLVPDGVVHNLLVAMMIPATSSLFASILFMSLDVYRLLLNSYDFWFIGVINALNWVTLAVLLEDWRVLMAFSGWLSYQVVISVDACHRTFPTAIKTMIIGIPAMVALCSVIAFRSVHLSSVFSITIRGHWIADAMDVIGFTTTTLAVLLGKMFVLKQRSPSASEQGAGYLQITCATIKTNLRLVPLTGSPPEHRDSPPATAPHIQPMKLSTTTDTQINARRTILPFKYWKTPPLVMRRHTATLRSLLYATGVAGYVLLSVRSVNLVHHRLEVRLSSDSQTACNVSTPTDTDWRLAILGSAASGIFCGTFALFLQRDLLWRLVFNFDYGFSIAQVTVFIVCTADMLCWEPSRCITLFTWLMWFIWAMSMDALTPFVKHTIFRFRKIYVAPIIITILALAIMVEYVIVILSMNGLRDRIVFTIKLSTTHVFQLRTKSVLIGRMVTLCLWCMRQVVNVVTHREDELDLIRGLVEYESPYATFPRKYNTHTPAIDDE